MAIKLSSAPRLQQTLLSTSLALALTLATTASSANVRDRVGSSSLPHSSAASVRHANVASTPASTTVVTNCNDRGAGSLRDAAETFNDNVTVDLTQLACSTITLTSGPLDINSLDITFQGPGASRLAITAGGASNVIFGYYDGTVSITDLTISGGSVTSSTQPKGGCIYSRGDVALVRSVVTACLAQNTDGGNTSAKGGAIYAQGNVALVSSTVSDSLAYSQNPNFSASGGGIYARDGIVATYSSVTRNVAATVTGGYNGSYGGGVSAYGNTGIYHSTISGNISRGAAGIMILGANGQQQLSRIVDSTISDNTGIGSSAFTGGAIYARINQLDIVNSTITGNLEANASNMKYGAGLYLQTDTSATIESSIIAGNNLEGPNGLLQDDIGGHGAINGANNLIEFSQISLPSDTINADPMLGPLASNGGPTQTHAPVAGSPAIDAGNNQEGDSYDQRGPGFARSVGAAPDIGAVEYSDTIFADGFEGG